MKPLSDKSSSFTDSVIRRMTRVSIQYDAVNLSQGFPDFDPPKEITDRLAEVAATGPHQYALTWGAKNFRDALAKKQKHFSGMDIEAALFIADYLDIEMEVVFVKSNARINEIIMQEADISTQKRVVVYVSG